MTKNRARKLDTRDHAAAQGLTHAQAAQDPAFRAGPRPVLSEGVCSLDLWCERDWNEGETEIPRCFGCGNELPEGQWNVLLPDLPERDNGLCRTCLYLLREKLDEAVRVLGAR